MNDDTDRSENENEDPIFFSPSLKTIQRIALYETKARFYVVGSNNTQTYFRVIKIDRMEPKKLSISDDKTVYSNKEIRDLLTMIDVGNRSKIGQKIGSGLTRKTPRTVSAFGIAGFMRFLEGYYIILITKRRRVGVIGLHTIYKVEDTSMIYIPHDSVREPHNDEPRYVKMFQAIDLSSNFYYSYSYDLTHSLQHNMCSPSFLSPPSVPISEVDGVTSGNHYTYTSGFQSKFVWNEYLLKGTEDLDTNWIIPIVHGFVDQSNVSIYGKPVYVTLIARRSKKYAGTRFLKRGSNFDGDVANEVETEQIACDASIGASRPGHYTSFVQMRGSVPGYWSQDISKIQPKPPIFFETQDPFASTAGKHFNELLQRYGSPIVVVNLVKKRERRRHEVLLSEELSKQIRYLNQFLPTCHKFQYIHFDMARSNKSMDENVMAKLGNIAYNTVKRTGFFHSRPTFYAQKIKAGKHQEVLHTMQTGVIRTNCVDCLDRTNTAQFAVGHCALAFQLHALGVLTEPHIEVDTDCVRMLEEMYEDHGDTLALQYGGSQLVHRIKTYRKLAPWTSKGNDIMQTMRRYYSNTLSDAEKQNTMNLFLGIFVPNPSRPPIWEKDQMSDYYLHHRVLPLLRRPITQWWAPDLDSSLPQPHFQVNKVCSDLARKTDKTPDLFDDYYRPFEFTVMQDLFPFSEINHSVRDYMPNFTTDFSPFSIRVRLGKKREEMSTMKTNLVTKNPSVAGNSTSSTTSTEDSDDDTDDNKAASDEDDSSGADQDTVSMDTPSGFVSFESLFPSTKQVYGFELTSPSPSDLQMYRQTTAVSRDATNASTRRTSSTTLPHPLARPYNRASPCPIPVHDYEKQLLKPVSEESMEIYKRHIMVGEQGAQAPSAASINIYVKYVNMVKG